jgi:hypothetical protein
MDLEDALEELKAEFEKMDGDNGDDDNGDDKMDMDKPDMDMDMDMDKPEEESIEPTIEGEDEAVEETEETEVEESKKTVEEHLREYSEMVKASSGGDDDKGAKSPVASNGGSTPTASPVKTDTKAEAGGKVSAPKADTTAYANRGGKGKVKPMPAPKPDMNDGAANKTSPVAKG